MHEFDYTKLTKKTVTSLTALEVKKLLTELLNAPKIGFRFRLVGEMWVRNMMQVSALKDKSVLFYDSTENRYHYIRFNSIMQFEVDERFQNFQPYHHYSVVPSSELE